MMRWTTRLLIVAGLLAGISVLGSPQARADVVFDQTAQDAFGIDENGEVVGSGPRSFMWKAFISTEEGRRILEKLEQAEAVITVKVVPDDQVGDGKAWGTTQALEWDRSTDDWIPTKIEILLAETPKGDVDGADTIHHEFRHAEIKVDGGGLEFERDRHDQMHAGRDSLNGRFQLQLDDWYQDWIRRDPFLDDRTPIYDSIKARADDDKRLSYLAQDLGGIFDISEPGPPTEFTAGLGEPVLDIEYLTGVRVAIETEIDPDAGQPGGGCGRTEGARTIICSPDSLDLIIDDILGVGIQLNTEIPANGSKVDVELHLDSDGDSGNDRQGEDVEDPEQGTDTTIGASYDPALGWTMWTMGPDGPFASGSRLVVEGDALTFLVPMSEIPGGGDAGFRVVLDQTHPDGRKSRDVSGISPSDPVESVPAEPVSSGCGDRLLGPVCGSQAHLNISRVNGHVTAIGDLWLEMVFEAPWEMAPAVDLPSTALFWSLVEDGTAVAGGQWSIHDGTTFGIAGYGESVVELDMFLSPWGSVFTRLPGSGMADGYSLNGHDLVVQTQTRHQLELDVETFDRPAEFPLTAARLMTGFTGPGPDWTAVVPEIGPVTLVIPEG